MKYRSQTGSRARKLQAMVLLCFLGKVANGDCSCDAGSDKPKDEGVKMMCAGDLGSLKETMKTEDSFPTDSWKYYSKTLLSKTDLINPYGPRGKKSHSSEGSTGKNPDDHH